MSAIRISPPARFAPMRRRGGFSPVIVASVTVLVVTAFAAIFGTLLFPDATKPDILNSLRPVGTPGHLLGTDQLGRDVFALSVAGTFSAVVGPVVIALGAAVFGVVLGGIAGYFGGVLDFLGSRIADLLLALPVVLVGIVVAGILGSGYWMTVLLLLVLFSPTDFRIARSAVLEQKHRPYIEAARMGGAGSMRVLAVHVLPNIMPLVLANFLINIAFAIVSLSSLSFLGLGVPDGTADWGRQLTDAQAVIGANPAAMITPALLIVLVACAVNLVGDRLSERAGGGPSVA